MFEFEFEFNSPLAPSTLADLFARSGWDEVDAVLKLEWAMLASEDWVTCSLRGELVGFGRTYQLDAVRRLVFDVVVDGRYSEYGLEDEIVRRLAITAPSLQEVAVFKRQAELVAEADSRLALIVGGRAITDAPQGAYLG